MSLSRNMWFGMGYFFLLGVPAVSGAKGSQQADKRVRVAQANLPFRTVVLQKKAGRARWLSHLSLSASLSSMLGSGSLAPSSYKNHYFAQNLGLRAGIRLPHRIALAAMWGIDVEYTLPDNASGRRLFWQDVMLQASWNSPIPAMAKLVNSSLSFRVDLPTSLAAQVSTRLVRVDGGIGLSKTLGPVTFRYGGGVSKSFHRYTSPVFNQANAETPSLFVRQDARLDTTMGSGFAPLPGTKNVSWMIRNTLSVRVQIWRSIAAGMSFGLFHGFKYASPDDAMTPTIRTVDGDVRADQVGRFDMTSGDLFVSWAPWRHLGFRLGVVSRQTPWNASRTQLRLPFLNLATANDNITHFYLQVTGSL